MKIFSKRMQVALITAFLLLSLSSTLVALPTASAHTPPWQIQTWTYIAATNNPIGTGQTLVVVFWTNAIPVTAQGQYGDRWTFHVEITKPDGSKETQGPLTSDPVGGSYLVYNPNQVGNYVFVAKFDGKTITGQPMDPRLTPAQQYNAIYWNDTFLPSESKPLTIAVQSQAVQTWPESPMPTDYWTRPVNDANRNWPVLLGNWLSGAAQNNGPTTSFVYGKGCETPHVMWYTPMWSGGYMDERFGDTGFQTGHYEGLQFSPPIIMDGRIFYNVNTYPKIGWYALSLYTGEVLYFHNTTGPVSGAGGGFNSAGSVAGESLSFGQIYNYGSPNQHGGFDYLWSMTTYNATTGQYQPNTWSMFDGFTGQYICSIANVSAGGTAVYGQDGSILRYNIVGTGANKRLTIWNTSHTIMAPSFFPGAAANAYWMWRPTLYKIFDGRLGFSLNVSIPNVQGSISQVREGKYVIGNLNGKVNDTYTQLGNMWALNLDPSKGEVGSLLWNITYAPPMNVPDASAGSGFFAAGVSAPIIDPEDGVFIFNNRITLEWYGYSLTTGQKLWGPTAPEGDMNYYGMYSNIYDGKLLSTGYSGVLMAYDIKTGNVLWNYTAPQIGTESPYGNYPMYITAIADGKIYTVSGEHSPTQPLWRGSYIRCIDADTGTEVWKVLHWGSGIGGAHLTGTAVYAADGNIVGLNLYDNQIYCYGKGPSKTTIDVKTDVISKGQSVLITGTVMDTSPGAEKKIASGEVAGMPAISDEDQEAWMEYVYADQVKPSDAKGVPVSIDIVDPNNNKYHIADVISDMSGGFKYLWTPEIPGEFTVTATFEGSKAFYSSSATTYVGVTPATPAPVVTPTATATQPPVTPATPTPVVPTPFSPSPTEAPTPPAAVTPVETYIAIAAAVIIIVAVAAALILRRRK